MACAMQTAMTFPDWLAPLDKALPKLGSAIRFALAAAATEGDKYQSAAASQKGKPSSKAANPAKKPDPKVTHITPPHVLHLLPQGMWFALTGYFASHADICKLSTCCRLLYCKWLVFA